MVYKTGRLRDAIIHIDRSRFVVYNVHIDTDRYEVSGLGNQHEETAKVFKALCDPNRLLIIEMLQSGEKCGCQLLDDLNIGQSTLSHHMKNLCESGVVNCRREGKWMFYSLNKPGCVTAYNVLTGVMEAPVQSDIDERCICE